MNITLLTQLRLPVETGEEGEGFTAIVKDPGAKLAEEWRSLKPEVPEIDGMDDKTANAAWSKYQLANARAEGVIARACGEFLAREGVLIDAEGLRDAKGEEVAYTPEIGAAILGHSRIRRHLVGALHAEILGRRRAALGNSQPSPSGSPSTPREGAPEA